jgi:hypothetical protein
LVGSSSRSRSGWPRSRRQRATRRRSPPDSDLEAGVEVPGIGRVDSLLHVGELGGGLLRVVCGQLVEAVEQLALPGEALLDVAANVPVGIERRLLLEQADGRAGGQLRIALKAVVEARHDPKQGRLAGAVVAEDADLGPWKEGHRDVGQHLPVGRIDPRQAVHRVDVLDGHAARG